MRRPDGEPTERGIRLHPGEPAVVFRSVQVVSAPVLDDRAVVLVEAGQGPRLRHGRGAGRSRQDRHSGEREACDHTQVCAGPTHHRPPASAAVTATLTAVTMAIPASQVAVRRVTARVRAGAYRRSAAITRGTSAAGARGPGPLGGPVRRHLDRGLSAGDRVVRSRVVMLLPEPAVAGGGDCARVAGWLVLGDSGGPPCHARQSVRRLDRIYAGRARCAPMRIVRLAAAGRCRDGWCIWGRSGRPSPRSPEPPLLPFAQRSPSRTAPGAARSARSSCSNGLWGLNSRRVPSAGIAPAYSAFCFPTGLSRAGCQAISPASGCETTSMKFVIDS